MIFGMDYFAQHMPKYFKRYIPSKVVAHPNFVAKTYQNDICLLLVNDRIEFNAGMFGANFEKKIFFLQLRSCYSRLFTNPEKRSRRKYVMLRRWLG